MKYLVTGGAGFIGSNIVKKLVETGNDVRIVDNLSTGKFQNIKNYLDKAEFVLGDLCDYDITRRAVEGIDYIIHQAAVPSVKLSIDNPIMTNNSTVTATINLLNAAVEAKSVKRVVQAGSSAAYGDSLVLPKTEDMIPDPLSPYAAAKLAQEYYGQVFYRIYGLEVISLRYFNVFGPNQNANSVYSAVIPKFLNLMMSGKQPIIFGDGLSSRDFIYVDNIVEANLLACKCEWTGNAEVINIGSGESTTLNQLINIMNNLLNTNVEPIYDKAAIGDIRHSIADISKAKKILKYDIKVSLRNGLSKLIEYYNNTNIQG